MAYVEILKQPQQILGSMKKKSAKLSWKHLWDREGQYINLKGATLMGVVHTQKK